MPVNAHFAIDDMRIAVIGLGYVGLPLATALSAHFYVTGYDIDHERIGRLVQGCDDTGELIGDELSALRSIRLSSDAKDIAGCNVFIVAVPTPVDASKLPDLRPLRAASQTVGQVLKPGDLVIYESTVYPGATEEVCVPELERASGLAFNVDFYCGYSPERINPGDRQRRIGDIVKVTSGSTPAVAEFVDQLYRRIIKAGTHLAPSIKVAEAAKAVENTQRDINIAFANELAMMFHRMGIDTEAVLKAAETKWNFMSVRPGLVGGHCIGVDPYYLIHKAEEVGAAPTLIRAAREINEGMSEYVTLRLVKKMAQHGIALPRARILVLGITFKENCADLRNTRALEIVRGLESMQAVVDVHDPVADVDGALNRLGIRSVSSPAQASYDAVLIAVAHRAFAASGAAGLRAWLKTGGVLFDARYALTGLDADERI
jgi:UDP-N-acetyl-D-glucosamine/UDP-N-acetyl-D-galactosamine dehydrogenase